MGSLRLETVAGFSAAGEAATMPSAVASAAAVASAVLAARPGCGVGGSPAVGGCQPRVRGTPNSRDVAAEAGKQGRGCQDQKGKQQDVLNHVLSMVVLKENLYSLQISNLAYLPLRSWTAISGTR
jgi:hypothetical protein